MWKIDRETWTPMETFACYDVMKNPDIDNNFNRFDVHLNHLFPMFIDQA